MKLNKCSLTAIVLASMLLSAFSVAADPPPPPPLPSSFYGEISLAGVSAGELIEAFVDSQAVRSAYDEIESIGGKLVYAIIVPAYPDGTYPAFVTFKINNKSVASAPWVSGTSVELNLAKINISLVAGWNLVSFNVIPISTDIRDVLASIQGKYSLVYAWNASEPDELKQWLKYIPDPGFPFERNSLQALDERMGFWINMDEPATLTMNGVYYPKGKTQIQLKVGSGGWNLVGFPLALPGALENHGVDHGDYTVIWRYEAHEADEGDKWKKFYPDPGYPNNDFTALSPGWGYWIYITAAEDLVWEVQ